HARIRAGAGVARVHVAVESEAEPRGIAFDDAHRVRSVRLDLLADGFDAVLLEPREDELGDRLLLSGRAWDAGEIAAELSQLVAIDLRKDSLGKVFVERHARLR